MFFYHILVSVEIRIRKYTCTKMKKKNNKQTKTQDGVCGGDGGGGCLYVSVVQYGIHLNQLQSSI